MAVQQAQSEETRQLWAQVLVSVKGRLASEQTFETWFSPIVPLTVTPQQVDLEVPNAFFVDWIHEHHLNTLRQGLVETLGVLPDVRFQPREAEAAPAIP